MIHNVFAGNPGSGKSTIANTLIGDTVFRSGISFGTGLTTVLDTHEHKGEKFSDTPGLDDIKVREKAAEEISTALSRAEILRLVFVCTLEDGRVRPPDVITIDTILDAICEVGVSVDGGFSLIINKCNDGVLTALEANPKSRKMVTDAFANGRMLEHVYFAPKCSEAEGMDNVLLPFDEELTLFLSTAPVLRMPGIPITIDLSYYQERLNDLLHEISRLRTIISRLGLASQSSDGRPTLTEQITRGAALAFVVGVLRRAAPYVIRAIF